MSDELVERLRDWPYMGETYAEQAADRIEALEAKLDRISDAWSSAVYCDLENGVASLNTRAEDDFAKRYPSISAFGGALLDIVLEGENDVH